MFHHDWDQNYYDNIPCTIQNIPCIQSRILLGAYLTIANLVQPAL